MSEVQAFGQSDSLLFGGYFGQINQTLVQEESNIPQIGNNWNSLHFEFTTPLFEHQNSVEYSYRLIGLNDNWSEWTKKTEKDYTNLPARKYTFQVKSKYNLGGESEITEYILNVLPPWYLTYYAFAFYTILFIAFNYLFYLKLKISYPFLISSYN